MHIVIKTMCMMDLFDIPLCGKNFDTCIFHYISWEIKCYIDRQAGLRGPDPCSCCLLSFPETTHVRIASSIAVDLSAKLAQNNSLPAVCWQTTYRESQQLLQWGIYVLFWVIRMPLLGLHWILLICTSQLLYLSLFIPSATLLKSDQPTFSVLCGFKS